jgi:hypothetical protein
VDLVALQLELELVRDLPGRVDVAAEVVLHSVVAVLQAHELVVDLDIGSDAPPYWPAFHPRFSLVEALRYP